MAYQQPGIQRINLSLDAGFLVSLRMANRGNVQISTPLASDRACVSDFTCIKQRHFQRSKVSLMPSMCYRNSTTLTQILAAILPFKESGGSPP